MAADGRRGSLLGYALAFVMPGLAAATLASTLVPEDSESAQPPSAQELARLAEQAPLRPIVLRDGRAALGSRPQEAGVLRGPRPGRPAAISIPAAGVRARVQAVSEKKEGIEVPPVGRAGWFSGGARPGETGRAVVVGHLDTRKGPGLFARLPDLPDGSSVTVRDRRGDVHRYEVVGKTVVSKARFPAEAVYGRSQRPVLVLVTCGGPWSKATGYRDNVIVYARAA